MRPRRKRSGQTTTSPGEAANGAKASLALRAYAELEEMIATLELRPGSIITEGELAARIGIGRTPMREAIQRLAAIGLVTTLPRRGMIVSEIDLAGHLGVLETRRVLERLIAGGAARRATPAQRDDLKNFAGRMIQAAADGDLTSFMLLDQEFDQLLLAASHNRAAAQAVAPLHIHCRRFWVLYRHQDDLQRSALLHRDLINAIAAADEHQAAIASEALMDYLEEFTRSAFELYLSPTRSDAGAVP